MAKFEDSSGKVWTIQLNVGLVGQLRREAKFDLGGAVRDGEKLAELLFTDPEILVGILWVCCEPQAQTLGVSAEQFGFGFDGPAISRAVDALLEAIIDFFHRPATAAAMKAKMPTLLNDLDQKMTAALEKQADSISSPNAGSLPASSAATPGN